MLYQEAVEPNNLERLSEICRIPYFEEMRLVGGTALALQMGHRLSVDLVFFGRRDFNDEEMAASLRGFSDKELMSKSPNIKVYQIRGIKVDFVNYPYRWIDGMIMDGDIRMAGFRDIAAMKINAITGRGTKKDFVDLFFLLQRFSFSEMVEFYLKKFTDANLFLALRSLIYFEDADKGQVDMLDKKHSWQKMKKEIVRQYNEYLANNNLL